VGQRAVERVRGTVVESSKPRLTARNGRRNHSMEEPAQPHA
jgi:hypothetical protein